MIYTVKEVTPERIVVEFENESFASISIDKSWDKEEIKKQISRYVPAPNFNVPFDRTEDVPFEVGESDDVESSIALDILNAKLKNEEYKRQQKERELNQEKSDNEDVGYTFFRQMNYPSIYDQLDALYWSRNGNSDYLEQIDQNIKSVKELYPKDMAPVKRKEILNIQDSLLL